MRGICKDVRVLHIGLSLVFLMAAAFFLLARADAEDRQKAAVLRFDLHASEPLEGLSRVLQEMLGAMIAEKGIAVVSPDVVNEDGPARLQMLEASDFHALGEKLGAKWIIYGSLTQLGRKISLDVKLLDTAEQRPPIVVFSSEGELEELDTAAREAANSIHDHIGGTVRIDSLRVVGNRRIEEEAILSVVQTQKGASFDREKLDEDLRAIYGMGFFKEVNIQTEDRAGGKTVILEVVEKPSISRIGFKGNRRVSEDDLKKEVGIQPYAILDLNEIQQSVNRLKEFYRGKSCYHVEVKERLEDLPGNQIALIFEIQEGEKAYVRGIELSGNTQFKDSDLKKIMETRKKGPLSWFTKSGMLDEKTLELDIQKLTAFYHNHGYIQARVGKPDIRDVEGKGLIVSIKVVEGPRYKVNDVKVEASGEGGLAAESEKLLTMIHVGEQEYFSREVVQKDASALKDFYADEGYAYAEIAPSVKEDELNHLVNITYSIDPGKKVRIDRIRITGNVSTRDKVIRRELKLQEGDYFSGKALRKSLENLNRLGYFEDVEIKPGKSTRDIL